MKFISALAWLERTSNVWKTFLFFYFSDEWSQILYGWRGRSLILCLSYKNIFFLSAGTVVMEIMWTVVLEIMCQNNQNYHS